MGIFNIISGFGGNLAHLDTHHEEDIDTVSDLLEQSRKLSTDTEYSRSSHRTKSTKSVKLKDRVRGSSYDPDIDSDNEEKYQSTNGASNGAILTTVQSQKTLDDQEEEERQKKISQNLEHEKNMQLFIEDSLRNSEPHCGSIHELPRWYSMSAESYILCGYRMNYMLNCAVNQYSMFIMKQ